MSTATDSFIDQLEAAASPAVIGTKKAAKALDTTDIKTSQQARLGDMGTYKRRQKKMEKGLLNQEVEKEKSPQVDAALNELASLFQGITGEEIQEEVKEEPEVLQSYSLPEEDNIVPFLDPKVIEEGAKQLQDLFTDISGVELFGERPKFEEEVVEIPVTPPEGADDMATVGCPKYPPPRLVISIYRIPPSVTIPVIAVAVTPVPTRVRV